MSSSLPFFSLFLLCGPFLQLFSALTLFLSLALCCSGQATFDSDSGVAAAAVAANDSTRTSLLFSIDSTVLFVANFCLILLSFLSVGASVLVSSYY